MLQDVGWIRKYRVFSPLTKEFFAVFSKSIFAMKICNKNIRLHNDEDFRKLKDEFESFNGLNKVQVMKQLILQSEYYTAL